MQYYVIGPNGEKFGPADETLLKQWAEEGRIEASTQLEHDETGIRVPAIDVVPVPSRTAPTGAAPSQPPSPSQPPPPSQPAPGPIPEYGTPADTTFGARAVPYSVSPTQLAGWNWGAFVFTWIWGLNHKAYLTLLSMIPYVGFAVAIYCGIKGNQWAWESGRFNSIQELEDCQAVWRTWAFVMIALWVAIILLAILLPVFFAGSNGVQRPRY